MTALSAVLYRGQEFGVYPAESGQELAVFAIGLLLVLRDQSDPSSVGDDDFVAAFTEQSTDPRRVRARFDHDARSRPALEAS